MERRRRRRTDIVQCVISSTPVRHPLRHTFFCFPRCSCASFSFHPFLNQSCSSPVSAMSSRTFQFLDPAFMHPLHCLHLFHLHIPSCSASSVHPAAMFSNIFMSSEHLQLDSLLSFFTSTMFSFHLHISSCSSTSVHPAAMSLNILNLTLFCLPFPYNYVQLLPSSIFIPIRFQFVCVKKVQLHIPFPHISSAFSFAFHPRLVRSVLMLHATASSIIGTHIPTNQPKGQPAPDVCQCGPRCKLYTHELHCSRCCTSVMKRRSLPFLNYPAEQIDALQAAHPKLLGQRRALTEELLSQLLQLVVSIEESSNTQKNALLKLAAEASAKSKPEHQHQFRLGHLLRSQRLFRLAQDGATQPRELQAVPAPKWRTTETNQQHQQEEEEEELA
ncbi:hypothetical protein GPALN_010913 [Globodera pallida]|nr:hypothetical protein GPALN_010913 [Globodera pallida]